MLKYYYVSQKKSEYLHELDGVYALSAQIIEELAKRFSNYKYGNGFIVCYKWKDNCSPSYDRMIPLPNRKSD